MNLAQMSVQAKKFTVDNSPLILTVVGVVGTISTAVLTHKATIKAFEILYVADANKQLTEDKTSLTRQETFKLTWMCYLPPLASCSLTVGAIVFSNRISTTRLVGLAAAYSLTEKKQEEYRAKIQEKLGLGKEQQARDELAQDRVDKNPPTEQQMIIVSGSEVLCFDQFSGRYFRSDMETIRRSENEINKQIMDRMYASVSDFYERIGLPPTSYSEEIGWNGHARLELKFSSIITPEGKPAIAFDFKSMPIRNFDYANCMGDS